MVGPEKTSCSRHDLLPLFNSRWFDAIYRGILACESGRRCWFDGVPVDERNSDRDWDIFDLAAQWIVSSQPLESAPRCELMLKAIV